MSFEKIARVQGRPQFDGVRLRKNRATCKIIIGRPIIEALGWNDGRVDVEAGDGRDIGLVRIKKGEEFALGRTGGERAKARLITSKKLASLISHQGNVPYRIENGALIVDLRGPKKEGKK